MPFGLKNAPATFQRLMENILHDTTEFAVWYIDDISVFSRTWDNHLRHLEVVLIKLTEAGLTLQLQKCTFATTHCEFLWHHVGGGKLSPQTAKINAVSKFCRPKTKADVRAFLGLAGYYRRYIPHFSGITASLSDLTRGSLPDKIQWSNECQDSFDTIKKILTSHPTLSPPDYSKPFVLQTDASDRGIGAVLSQGQKADEHPIAFYSRKLLLREQKYGSTEKEGLAVVDACRHFIPYLMGRKFTIVTDNRALKFLANKDPTSGRLARWLDTLRDLEFDIQYRPRLENRNADGLSRQAWMNYDTLQKEGEVSGSSTDPTEHHPSA